MMEVHCKVSISRRSNDVITIQVQDEASLVQFLELKMTPEAFALALTGLSHQKSVGTVRGLDVVGKTRITETRQAVYSGNSFDSRETMETWLEENCQEEGWTLDTYLGSQQSVSRASNGRALLNYRVMRWTTEQLT